MHLLFFIFFIFISPALAQDYRNDLLKLSQSIRQTEKQKIEIENRLIELQSDYKHVSKNTHERQYDATRSLHQYQSLSNTQYKQAYLLQDQSFFERFFHLRHQKTISDISKHELDKNISELTDIDEKSKQINHFLNKRKTLELTLNAALKQVKDIQK
jgi:hypothetical protein